jgi:sec-independent protein translocase protein TatB
MFDIGWSELLVIAVVAILVVGPKDLPKLMRGIGHYAGKLRRAAADFQRQFEDAMRESEIEEMRKAIESVKVEGPPADFKAPIDQPVMLPTPEAAKAATAKPKPQRKRGPTKSKTASAKRGKKPAEPAP